MSEHPTVADVLVRGFGLPALDAPPDPCPHGTRCAITGVEITNGYPVRALLQKSTAVILDTVRGPLTGHVSDAAARCWKSTGPGARLMLGGIAFADGASWQPTISIARGVETGRGCWRDVVRDVWPARAGQSAVIILTTDYKKRLWTGARAGPLGEATPLLLCDGAIQQTLTVSWPRLLVCLDLVERVYARGFPKAAIREGLGHAFALADAWGLADTLALDRELAGWRGSDELTVALLIAQRDGEVVAPPLRAVIAIAPSSLQGSLFDV